jgi:hypothetical protein
MSNWRFTYWRSLLSIAIAGTSFLPGSYALAQIVPDAWRMHECVAGIRVVVRYRLIAENCIINQYRCQFTRVQHL